MVSDWPSRWITCWNPPLPTARAARTELPSRQACSIRHRGSAQDQWAVLCLQSPTQGTAVGFPQVQSGLGCKVPELELFCWWMVFVEFACFFDLLPTAFLAFPCFSMTSPALLAFPCFSSLSCGCSRCFFAFSAVLCLSCFSLLYIASLWMLYVSFFSCSLCVVCSSWLFSFTLLLLALFWRIDSLS